MAQYNSLNVKLPKSQLIKLKPAIKNKTEVILKLSSNIIGNSNNKINFPHECLLSNRHVVNLIKAFANYSSTDIKLPKAQLSKMIQRGGFLGRLLSPLLKSGLSLKINVF